jgi:large subunit ribosomal protein L6
MSRLGKKPVPVPPGVKVQIQDRTVSLQGPKGAIQWEHRPEVSVAYDAAAAVLRVSRKGDDRLSRALHGLTRAMLQNMVIGVHQGYEKRLEIQGVGYLAALQGNVLQLRVGYANEVHLQVPPGVKVAVPDQQHIVITGIDKQLVGQFAADVRRVRPPEPYKGKGIRYLNEVVRRKQGKAVVK